MAGTIVADTIQTTLTTETVDRGNGSGAVTRTAEGSVSTKFVVRGSCKMWARAGSTTVITNSLNVSSATDNDGGTTGNSDFSVINGFAEQIDNYACTGLHYGNAGFIRVATTNSTSTVVAFANLNTSGSAVDRTIGVTVQGDLA